ncbi:MAG: hypothetical protein MJ238_02465 [Bacilli bacterium]|nr:hypothetical protein [Bacilli bacterium]
MLVNKKDKKVANGFRLLFGYLGLFIMVEGILTLLPLVILAFYPAELGCWMDFVIPGGLGIVLGALMFLILIAGRKKGKFGKHGDSLLLVLLWISAILLGALPFLIDGIIGNITGDTSRLAMDFSESFFESMSGYSATGLTVYTGFLDSTYPFAHVFLFHRALMQFIGGVGLVLVVTSVVSDKYNLKLFFAEGHNDHLLPNMGKTARWIFLIYTVYIVIGAVALWCCGMPFFDAMCHSISSLATGGFSTRSTGLLYFQETLPLGNQIAMEIVFEVLMVLGATSFVIHFLIFTVFVGPAAKLKERFWSLFRDFELRFSTVLMVVLGFMCAAFSLWYSKENPAVIADYVAANGPLTFWQAFRFNFFNVVSCLSTTGYSNCGLLSPSTGSLAALGQVSILVSIFLMIIGGAVGSTGGGIKQARFGVAMKEFYWSVKNKFASSRTLATKPIAKHGEMVQVTDGDRADAYNYSFLYLMTLAVGSFLLLMLPYVSFQSAFYNFASALSGTGLALFDFEVEGTMVYSFLDYKNALIAGGKSVAPYYATLWIIDLGMILGRLEILACYYAIKSLVYDPVKEYVNVGSYRGIINVLKAKKMLAIRSENMLRAEALDAVIKDYEYMQKTNIEVNGSRATLNKRDMRYIIQKKRDEYITLYHRTDEPELKEKYYQMAVDLNWYMPRKYRKRIYKD